MKGIQNNSTVWVIMGWQGYYQNAGVLAAVVSICVILMWWNHSKCKKFSLFPKIYLAWQEWSSLFIYVNSSAPSATYMCQWIRSTFVQIMACPLFDTKPLCEPMLIYCHLDPYKQTSVMFYCTIQNLSFMKMHVKILSTKGQPFCPGGDKFICMAWWHLALWKTVPGGTVLERSTENHSGKNSEGPATQHANLGTKQVVSFCSW